MSAKLKEFGSINSFNDVNKYLSNDDDKLDFKDNIIAISGYGDLICFGFEKSLLLASMDSSYNCNNTSNGISFTISSQDHICDQNELITSILVLPISSLKQSSQGLPDWTCVCVGLSSGYVQFFNQFGQSVFSQKFHTSSIEAICLRGSPKHNQPDMFTEDLMIVCDNCCYQIDGVYLYESLNTFKKQLIRFQAGFIDDQWNICELGYKKWLLEPHDIVSGMLFGYETCESVMDNIFNNVVTKGPYLSISEETTKHINCVIVGKMPFVSFYKMPLESDSLDMGDLAHAVFSKVKGVLSTSISSWMGSFTSSAPVKSQSNKPITKKTEMPVPELPSRLQCRHVIEEPSRHASMIVGCPHHNKQSRLAAITDDFGRIFLLDIDDGIVLRMWKGYRDAQISISTTCDGSSSERSVNYLIIYSPRRSLIEVWTLPFGDKIASFDVRDRNGRLLNVPHTSLGFSRAQIINQKIKNVHSTYFLDSTGKISVLDIPFHLSLSSSSNERSQDHLILKHFKNVIRSDATKSDVTVIRGEFSSSIRLLKLACSVELLMHNVIYLTYLPHDMIISIIEELLELLSSGTLASLSDRDSKRLKTNWTGTKALIQSYLQLSETIPKKNVTSDIENLGELLNLESDDFGRIRNLYNYYCRFNKITRSPSKDSTYMLFVNNFTLLPNSSDDDCEGFQLSKNVSEKDVLKIGSVLFGQYVVDDYPIDDVMDLLISRMKVDRSSCFRLCLSYLINEGSDVLMDNLSRVKQILSRILSSTDDVTPDLNNQYRLLRSSLQLSYEMIEKSSNIMTCLILAMTIRVIILDFLQGGLIEKEEFMNSLSDYLTTWNETCQRLEDLAIFDCLLKCRPLSEKSKKVNVSFDRELILSHVLENGKGVFSERFAKWALKWNLQFSHINGLYKSLASRCIISGDDNPLEEEFCLSTDVIGIFAILYKQLPHSLEYDSVLINVAWEYTRLWSKSIQRIEYLENACELLENIGPAGGLVIQGIGSMIWDMYIVVGLSTLFPIDISPGQQYSSQLACEVAVNVIRFLHMLIKALENVDVMPTFSTEAVWSGDKSRSSLIDMAVNKDLIVVSALELHLQLLYALELVHLLNVPKFNCYSLFSKETRRHIFKPLTTGSIADCLTSDNVECKTYRMLFLEKCIECCVKKFSEVTENTSVCQRTNTTVKSIAERWNIDPDDVLQSWIYTYYQFGLDSQGAMYLDKVANIQLLGNSLLRIVGCRIKKEYLLPDTKYYRECSKYVTPQLKKWLQNIDDKMIRETVVTSLDRSDILLSQILEWIPENCLEFEAATCLQSLILNIQRTKKYIE